MGVNVLLGPGLCLKRSPLCGRDFEYFSEDPYLAGKMAAGFVRGVQSQGVAACPKHFAANSQETRRQASDSVMDERTLRELYLTGFEHVVREAHPQAIMSSYNLVNGTYANENDHLLTQILRNEWGFDGAVVTDWGGSVDHVAGVRAGSTFQMPAPGMDDPRALCEAVRAGRLAESVVDDRVRRAVRPREPLRPPGRDLGALPCGHAVRAHVSLRRGDGGVPRGPVRGLSLLPDGRRARGVSVWLWPELHALCVRGRRAGADGDGRASRREPYGGERGQRCRRRRGAAVRGEAGPRGVPPGAGAEGLLPRGACAGREAPRHDRAGRHGVSLLQRPDRCVGGGGRHVRAAHWRLVRRHPPHALDDGGRYRCAGPLRGAGRGLVQDGQGGRRS
jgi:hypothetical protein